MRRFASMLLTAALLLACLPATRLLAQSDAVTLDAGSLRAVTEKLTALPHRLSGSAQGQAAGDIILQSLKQAGIDDSQVMVQSFPVVNIYPQDEAGATLTFAGRRIELRPLRANGLMPASTPAGGITGRIVPVGDCDWPALSAKVTGQIALVGAQAGPRWRRLIDLAPAAIVFEASDDIASPRWLDAPLELPRFEIAADDARLLAQQADAQATLRSRLAYEKRLARNIIVNLPGRQPAGHKAAEAILLMVSYDTFGDTPYRARNDRQAANVAGLVEAARWLKAHPPARPVTLVFFDNNAQAQSGQVWFQWARITGQPRIDELAVQRQQDLEWTRQVLQSLRDPAAVVQTSLATPVARQAQKLILQQAELEAASAVSELSAARLAMSAHERQSELTPEQLKLDRQYQELEKQVRDYEAQRATILQGRRLISQGRVGDQPGQMHPFVENLFGILSDQFTRRQRELEQEVAWMLQASPMARALADRQFVMAAWLDVPLSDTATVIALPSAEVTGFVINQHAGRELKTLVKAQFADDAPLPMQTLELSPMSTPAAATAAMSWTMVLGQHGLQTPPSQAWSPRFVDRFTQSLGLLDQMANLASLSGVRLPTFSPALSFNMPSMVEPGRYDGCSTRLYDEQTKLGKTATGAVLMIHPRQPNNGLRPESGCLPYSLTISDQTGAFWLTSLLYGTAQARIRAAAFDDAGQLRRLSQYNPASGRGTTGSWESASWYIARDAIQIPLFNVRRHGVLTHLTTLGGVVADSLVKLINGRSDVPLRELHADADRDIYTLHTGRTAAFKMLGSPLLAINNTLQSPLGSGYATDGSPVNAVAATARDLWRLNESRLDQLRRHGIDLPWIEQQHTLAQSLLDSAQETDDAQARQADLAISMAYSHRAYQPIRDVTNDLISSVVILLLLAVPFAYACERLVGGSGDVFRQIIGFSIIFLLTFAILFWVHPAFRFAGYPLIVLLAFLIIIMSALVIWIMWSKFEYEMRRFHGVATASHQNTRDARATVGAAIAQGIATMKRRPLRTALTMATIAILTFTVLFFGAFSAEPSVRWINAGINTQQAMVIARPAPASPWRDELLATLGHRWTGKADLYARAWDVASPSNPWVGRTPDGRLLTTQAWIAIPPRDLQVIASLRGALSGDVDAFAAQGGILLPESELQKFDPAWIGRPCQFMGRSYIVRGTFDPQALGRARTLDGAPILALDITEMKLQLDREFPGDPTAVAQRLKEMDASEYPTIDPAATVLISAADGNIPPDQVQAVVFLPHQDEDAAAIAGELAVLMDRAIFTNANGRAQRAVFHKELQLGGLWAIAVPLLLGSLLVFSSMMSSVADRQREIFTFSALGLAPRHIVLLFFAEATVYGLVGAMGGYLGAQVFAKFADAMGRLGLFDPPPLNYSSTNAVLTLVVVIAAVLVSTIYPALKASRSANPGIQRAWRMPAPVEDRLDLEFPFTVSHDDMTGLIVYLHEFFLQHADRSIGGFAAQNVHISQGRQGSYRINADVWLTPFDQGISQGFELRTEPSDIAGIDRVLLSMRRTGGSPAMWTRGNKLFVAHLREQFLLWRTLPDDTVDHYHTQGQALFDDKPHDGNAPASPTLA